MQDSSLFDSVPMIWPKDPAPGSITLRPYQLQAVNKIIEDSTSGKSRRHLAILATSLGKTPTAGAIAKWSLETLRKPVMMLAHREELLEQGASEFSSVIGPDYIIEIEQAERKATRQAHVVMASVATIGREDSMRIQKFPRDHFGVLIIDEVHHCTSSTFQNVINYFSPEKTGTILMGVTATPNRTDKESLSRVFDNVVINMDIVKGTREKFLTPIVSWRVDSTTDLSRVRTTAGDFNLKDLAAAVNNKERNTLIVETWQKRFPDKRALIFATDLEHVYRLVEEFQSIGVSAIGIDGTTPKEERRQSIADFKAGKIKICVNFGVLTEGYNDPSLELIIQARPTQSQLLLTQIAGRSNRLLAGKAEAHIVEIIDNHSEKTATVSKIFNFRQNFDCEGHNFLECVNKADEFIAAKEFFNPYNCVSWSEMLLRFERATDKNPKGLPESTFMTKMGPADVRGTSEDIYSVFDENLDFFDSRYRYFRSGQNLKLIHKDDNLRYQVIVMPNGLGGFDAHLMAKDSQAPRNSPAENIVAYRGASAPDAIKKMEDYMIHHYPSWDILLRINAPWRQRAKGELATEKQMNLITKFRLSTLTADKISKADAMNLISNYFNKNARD